MTYFIQLLVVVTTAYGWRRSMFMHTENHHKGKYPINNPKNSYEYIFNERNSKMNNEINKQIKNLNSKNLTLQLNEILANDDLNLEDSVGLMKLLLNKMNETNHDHVASKPHKPRITVSKNIFLPLFLTQENNFDVNALPQTDDESEEEKSELYDFLGNPRKKGEMVGSKKLLRNHNSNGKRKTKKSENFEMNVESPVMFNDIGGYGNIKHELHQCIDLLTNYTKYSKFNVRVPKGLIFEGPPGNGKTLFAKALAGEAHTNFIAVSGSEFQDKYVGVGPSRIRELFKFAKENIPCIIFIDEIDALGRKRSSDGEASSGERDNTLNELLISLDGFKNSSGIFVIGATNRVDLLDDALLRPGRIDKRIFINNPDKVTRKSIVDIHVRGKPHDHSVNSELLVEQTEGLSASQIENLLNEAMLNALRDTRYVFDSSDIDIVLNKMIAGWQPTEHEITSVMIDQIAIHELGHAVVGIFCKHHSKMTKVVINLSSPSSPAYTIFESTSSSFLTREMLFEHLMVLLSGRIAEESFYGVSVTTGAINDFEEALLLAKNMVCYYGMGKNVIYPSLSDKYKETIDLEVSTIINAAYQDAKSIIYKYRDLIQEGAELLKRDQILTAETMDELIKTRYTNVFGD